MNEESIDVNFGVRVHRLRIAALLLFAKGCDAFGSGGLGQFCFDDAKGVHRTGLTSCAQVKQQGHCGTDSYSKYCHRTCVICTDGAYFRPA